MLNNIWPAVKFFDTKRFWSKETIQRAMSVDNNAYKTLIPFPSLKKLVNITPRETNIRNLTWSKICDPDTDYGDFIDNVFFNKDLILYAQRAALSEWFHEIENYDLDDTNRPFDWDHISPRNAIASRKGIQQALKNWYGSNGNYRAWPYSLNRMDQDAPPSDKLNPKTKEDIAWWKEKRSYKINSSSNKSLKQYLLDLSFCEKKWMEVTNEYLDKIKVNGYAKEIIYRILDRNIRICTEWYEKLHIDDLFPAVPTKEKLIKMFDSIVNNSIWEGEKGNDDTYQYKLHNHLNNLHISFSFDNDPETILRKEEINFEIGYENDDEGEEAALKIKIPEYQKEQYEKTQSGYLGKFTLMSFTNDSIVDLFKDFYLWLKKFPDKEISDLAVSKFTDGIEMEYREKVVNTDLEQPKITTPPPL